MNSGWNIDYLILIDPVYLFRGDNASANDIIDTPMISWAVPTGGITKPSNVNNMYLLMSSDPGAWALFRYSAGPEDAVTMIVPGTTHSNIDENVHDSIVNILSHP